MTKTKKPFRSDARVQWLDDMRPILAPNVEGTVFTSTSSVTYVIWDGQGSRPQAVATVALTRA